MLPDSRESEVKCDGHRLLVPCVQTKTNHRAFFPALFPSINSPQLFLLARGAMLRDTHVVSVSTAGLSCTVRESERDVEHQLAPCDDGRPAAVRLKRDSNTVPGPQVSRGCWAREAPGLKGPWVVGGDVGEGHGAVRGRCVAWGFHPFPEITETYPKSPNFTKFNQIDQIWKSRSNPPPSA